MSKLQASDKKATVRFTVDMSETLHRKLLMLATKTGRKKVDQSADATGGWVKGGGVDVGFFSYCAIAVLREWRSLLAGLKNLSCFIVLAAIAPNIIGFYCWQRSKLTFSRGFLMKSKNNLPTSVTRSILEPWLPY